MSPPEDRQMTSAAAALVFDFDGVIADTEPLYWRAWRQMLTHYEFAFEWEDYCRIGRGIREDKMLESLSGMLANPQVMSEIRRRLPEHKEMVQQSRRDLAIPDATIQMFRSLRGRTLALVTSSDRRDIEPLLRSAGIAECFHASVFGDEIATHKPDPEPYLLIRAKLQLQDGVVFEDSEAGMLSARAAGFKAVNVTSPDELPKLVRQVLDRE